MRMEEKHSTTKEVRTEWHLLAIFTFVLVMLLGLFVNHFAITSHAQATGKVNTTANIRKEASTSSDVLAAALEGREVTIKGKTTASDGNVWYQIFVDSETLGFVRSDFIDVTEGSVSELTGATPSDTTPPSTTPSGTTPTETTGTDPGNEESPPDSGVTAVQPLSATVVGSEVRIRDAAGADTSDSIVATVQDGVVLTVDGYTTASDGNTWYRVSFLADNENVTGFVRDFYVTLEGELQPLGEAPEGGENNDESGQEPKEPVDAYQPGMDYTLDFEEEVWYLNDYITGNRYKLAEILDAALENSELFEKNRSTINGQKIAIIILVILAAGLGFAVTMLIFKIKDISDEAYFTAVEKETMRSRGEKKAQGGTGSMEKNRSTVMQTVGAGGTKTGRPTGSQGAAQGQRAQSGGQARPTGQGSGSGQGVSGQRIQGSGQARPAGQGAAGQRTQGGGQARPAGQSTAGQRTQGGGQARPAGQGAAGQRIQGGGQARPSGQGTADQRTQGSDQIRPSGQGSAPGQRVQGSGQNVQQQAARPEQQNPGWKSKNFMADADDEFEFEFLNWDGNEE